MLEDAGFKVADLSSLVIDRGDAGTQGIESFWAMLKRAHTGTFHKISPKHMDRYVTEFAGRHV